MISNKYVKIGLIFTNCYEVFHYVNLINCLVIHFLHVQMQKDTQFVVPSNYNNYN